MYVSNRRCGMADLERTFGSGIRLSQQCVVLSCAGTTREVLMHVKNYADNRLSSLVCQIRDTPLPDMACIWMSKDVMELPPDGRCSTNTRLTKSGALDTSATSVLAA